MATSKKKELRPVQPTLHTFFSKTNKLKNENSDSQENTVKPQDASSSTNGDTKPVIPKNGPAGLDEGIEAEESDESPISRQRKRPRSIVRRSHIDSSDSEERADYCDGASHNKSPLFGEDPAELEEEACGNGTSPHDDVESYCYLGGTEDMDNSPLSASEDESNGLEIELKEENWNNDSPMDGFFVKETKCSEIKTGMEYYINLKVAKESKEWREYIENYYLYYKTHNMPTWLDPSNIKDINHRKPEHDDYDYKTIYVPTTSKIDAKHLTPGMIQYWDIKKTRFDMIVLFKMGRFYELFYIDACIAASICDLKWMGSGSSESNKPHVGFPEQSIHIHANKLVNAGYRVVVVEQMETPKELENRNKNSNTKSKAVNRKICEVLSQGTLLHSSMLSVQPSYLLALVYSQQYEQVGFCYADAATSKLKIGFMKDGSDRYKFQTLLTRVQPREVILCPRNVPSDCLNILNMNSQVTTVASIPDSLSAKNEWIKYFQVDGGTQYDIPAEDETIAAFALIAQQLRNCLIDKKVLTFAKPENYIETDIKNLFIDGTSLKNLEILPTTPSAPSLYSVLNHTQTPFGARLLREWICSPLYEVSEIEDRGKGIQWLVENESTLRDIEQGLKGMGDVERQMAKVCARGIESTRGAIYFDNVLNNRLKEFLELMSSFHTIDKLANILIHSFKPTPFCRLRRIFLSDADERTFPILTEAVDSLERMIVKVSEKEFRPAEGVDPSYDEAMQEVNSITSAIEKERVNFSKQMELPISSFTFTHTKFRYELETSDDIPQSVLKHVEVTSTRKGFIRFHIEEIKELLPLLEEAEHKANDAIYPFFQSVFHQFHQHLDLFTVAVRFIAELDCLLSLALAQLAQVGPVCRPKFVSGGRLELRGSRHPVVSSIMEDFISNDIVMGGACDASIVLITGPNMGGKSTLLRQTCLCIILAQMGCFVPAESCSLSPVDRIFTRLGARDALLEGKSTFLVELEETSILLNQSTKNSVCIIDELGRGTSTYDGTAIALAALEHLADTVKCRCLFSTHYHLIADEVVNHKNIDNWHMGAKVDKENVTFLFKLIPGSCPSSYGVNVAQLAGIQPHIIHEAQAKAKELEAATKEIHAVGQAGLWIREIAGLLKGGASDSALLEFFNLNLKKNDT